MPDTTAVDQLLDAIEGAVLGSCAAFSPDVRLDATVPHWRFQVSGGPAVRAELSRWYADPGRFEELRRTPLPTGEVVEFTLRWEEGGIPHAAHQVHMLEVVDGLVVADRVWCGGRWPAALLAEMADAASGA